MVDKVGVIGAGKMGEALICGLLRSKKYGGKEICVFEILKNRADYISSKYHITITNSLKSLVQFSDIIFIVVKPFDVPSVLKDLSRQSLKNKIIVTVAAGVRIDKVAAYLPKDVSIIRIMPNLACSVGEGMIAVTPSRSASKASIRRVMRVLNLLGKVVTIQEKHMDAITGLSASGPAFIYLIIEALADAGVRVGLARDLSLHLSAQTVLGAGKMAVETREHPAKLKDMVVTPAGTTIEGLLELERGGVRVAIIDAVSRSTERAKELQPKNV